MSTDAKALAVPTDTPAAVPAGVIRRLLAYGIDVVVVSIAIVAASLAISAVIGPPARFDLTHPDPALRVFVAPGRVELNAIMATAVSAAYFAGSWWRIAATPSQRILGLRVADRRTSGARSILTARAALLRWIVLIPPFGLASALVGARPGIPAVLTAAGALWAIVLLGSTAFNRQRRGLHDRAGGSVVVRHR